MRRTIGRTYLGLGAFDQAVPHLDRALALHREQGDDFGVAFAQLLLGNHRVQRGDFKTGEAFLRQAVAYVRSRGARADPELHQTATADLALPSPISTQGTPRRSRSCGNRSRLQIAPDSIPAWPPW